MTPETVTTILWIYIALLFAGGLMGFIKAKSKISLITSAVFAAALAFLAISSLPKRLVIAAVVVGVLVLVFGMRFAKGKKFMPSGLMLALSAIMLAVLLLGILH